MDQLTGDLKAQALARWKALLADRCALLDQPGAYHASLLKHAYGMHQQRLIDRNDLADLLDLADSALEYAFEELLHIPADERWGKLPCFSS